MRNWSLSYSRRQEEATIENSEILQYFIDSFSEIFLLYFPYFHYLTIYFAHNERLRLQFDISTSLFMGNIESYHSVSYCKVHLVVNCEIHHTIILISNSWVYISFDCILPCEHKHRYAVSQQNLFINLNSN